MAQHHILESSLSLSREVSLFYSFKYFQTFIYLGVSIPLYIPATPRAAAGALGLAMLQYSQVPEVARGVVFWTIVETSSKSLAVAS